MYPVKHTFVRVFAHLATSAPRRTRPFPGPRARGFTLIELMVVVVIITLLATIAVPGISKRMQSFRTQQAASDIGNIYREARMRSIGRNAAVLVEFNAGVFVIREGIRGGADAGCAVMPEASCLVPTTRWTAGGTQNRIVDRYDFTTSGDFTVAASLNNAATTTLDVCFSPDGRSYGRVAGTALPPLVAGIRFDVNHSTGAGFQRSTVISPTGNARTVANE